MRNLVIFTLSALALIGCKPKAYEVKREIVIEAPAEVIFAEVNNLKAQEAWSPWEAKDPEVERSYEGPEAGVGAKYSWKGNDEVGHGSMEILEVEPNKYVKTNLIFTEPWQSESIVVWSFEPVDGGTKASWTVLGELPGYLFWMGQDDMEEAMGPEFETGLARLKEVAEERAKKPSYQHEVVEVESMEYYYIAHTVPFSEVTHDLYAGSYDKLMSYLAADAANMTLPPLSVIHEWNEETQEAKMEIAVACKSKKPAKGDIKKGKTYAGTAMKVSHIGPFESTGEAHEFLHSAIVESEYDMAGSPWEVYISGPTTNSNPQEWITDIYYPVKLNAAIQ